MSSSHIAIPYDQLELFKEEDKYQNYLIETLLYSTKVSLHLNNNKIKCILIVTKNNIWTEEINNHKKTNSFPLKHLVQVIKCQDHPELVFLMDQNYDNLRISTSNEERCQNIISSIAFYFTYLTQQKKPLKIYSIKQNGLLYFQRTVKQKKTGPKFNLQRYSQKLIYYVEEKDTPDLYGKLLLQKLLLIKQLYSENSHMIHIAKVNTNQIYICHTFDKDQKYCEAIRQHIPLDFVEPLLYSRCLEYKIQMFFQFLPTLKSQQISFSRLFQQLYALYDKMKKIDKSAIMTPDMLCSAQQPIGQAIILLRQFRYPFLLMCPELNLLIYKKIYNQSSESDYIMNKMYNIGLIMYHFLFGKSLFHHQDVDFIIYLKEHTLQIPFPKHLDVVYNKKVKNFIQKSILGHFQTEQDVRSHPWTQGLNLD